MFGDIKFILKKGKIIVQNGKKKNRGNKNMRILNKAKKILTVTVAVCVMAVAAVPIMGGEPVTITLCKYEDNGNKQVKIPVKISDNSEIGGCQITVKYDPNVLEYVKGNVGNILEDGAISDVNNTSANSCVNLIYISNDPLKSGGELFNVTFNKKTEVAELPIEMTVDSLLDATDAIGNVAFSIANENGTWTAPPDSVQTVESQTSQPPNTPVPEAQNGMDTNPITDSAIDGTLPRKDEAVVSKAVEEEKAGDNKAVQKTEDSKSLEKAKNASDKVKDGESQLPIPMIIVCVAMAGMIIAGIVVIIVLKCRQGSKTDSNDEN